MKFYCRKLFFSKTKHVKRYLALKTLIENVCLRWQTLGRGRRTVHVGLSNAYLLVRRLLGTVEPTWTNTKKMKLEQISNEILDFGKNFTQNLSKNQHFFIELPWALLAFWFGFGLAPFFLGPFDGAVIFSKKLNKNLIEFMKMFWGKINIWCLCEWLFDVFDF